MVKHVPQAIYVAVLAAAVTHFANLTGMILWIAFIGWASYFLAGHTIQKGHRTFFNLLLGTLGAFAIAYVGTNIGPQVGAAAFPIAVAGVVFVMIMSEEFKFYPFTNRAAWMFVGAAVFFASGLDLSVMSLAKITGAFLFGCLCGPLTVMGRTFIARAMKTPEPFAEHVAKPEHGKHSSKSAA